MKQIILINKPIKKSNLLLCTIFIDTFIFLKLEPFSRFFFITNNYLTNGVSLMMIYGIK